MHTLSCAYPLLLYPLILYQKLSPDMKWIQLMKCMRKAGVQIEALVEYVALFEQGTETVNARKNILVEQRAQLLERMKDLQESLDLLDSKIEHYEQVLVPAQESLRRPEDVETKKGA